MKKEKVVIDKVKYYGYIIPSKGEEIEYQDVTVCLILDIKGNWARGVTVFNRDQDVYDETIGRWQAKLYAERALKDRGIKKNNFSREKAIESLMRSRCPWTKKGEKNPELSYFERRLLFGKKWKENMIENEEKKKRKNNIFVTIQTSDPYTFPVGIVTEVHRDKDSRLIGELVYARQ